MSTEVQLLPLRLGVTPSLRQTPAGACRVLFTCMLLATSLPLAAQTQSVPTPPRVKHTIASKSSVPGVPQFGQVTPTLYRGAQPTEEGFANLARMGINIVVDLRGSRAGERQRVTALGMTYVPLPWGCDNPHDEHFAKFLTLLRENPGKKIFVHCRTGADRSGMDIAAYRMAEQGWTAEEAKNEMEAFGVNWFHRMICARLQPYEREFPERYKTSAAFESLRSEQRAASPAPDLPSAPRPEGASAQGQLPAASAAH